MLQRVLFVTFIRFVLRLRILRLTSTAGGAEESLSVLSFYLGCREPCRRSRYFCQVVPLSE